MPQGEHCCLGFGIGVKRAVPFVIIIGLITADALTIIAIATRAVMQPRALLAEMFVDPERHFLERLRTGDDLDQLFGDLRLACTVVLQSQAIDQLARITCRIVHCRH